MTLVAEFHKKGIELKRHRRIWGLCRVRERPPQNCLSEMKNSPEQFSVLLATQERKQEHWMNYLNQLFKDVSNTSYPWLQLGISLWGSSPSYPWLQLGISLWGSSPSIYRRKEGREVLTKEGKHKGSKEVRSNEWRQSQKNEQLKNRTTGWMKQAVKQPNSINHQTKTN